MLEAYGWPGNIRELENAVERAAALCDQVVRPEDLPEGVREFSREDRTAVLPRAEKEQEVMPLAEMEGRYVAQVLQRTGGNKQAAARLLGIDRTTLKRMIKRYNLSAGKEEE